MDDRHWVPAAPFRAHFNHVCDGAGLPWPSVALYAGLPLDVVAHLLDLRPGRQVHRITGRLARRVLAIDAEAIGALATSTVEAEPSQRAAQRLRVLGWSPDALAQRLHVSQGHLADLLTEGTPRVPALVDLRLRTLLALTEAARPDRPRRAA